jgi:hypothetical protein
VDLKDYLGPAVEAKKPGAAMTSENADQLSEKIIAALERSHCFFADLLEKFPKADYKTVASAVARLYEAGTITQDKEGRFELTMAVSQPEKSAVNPVESAIRPKVAGT